MRHSFGLIPCGTVNIFKVFTYSVPSAGISERPAYDDTPRSMLSEVFWRFAVRNCNEMGGVSLLYAAPSISADGD